MYVITFGEDDQKIFSTKDNYHYDIMQALTERGYAKIQGGSLKGESWIGKDGGYVVHADLAKGGKAIYFMTRDLMTASKVSEAVRLSKPGVSLHEPVKISSPN